MRALESGLADFGAILCRAALRRVGRMRDLPLSDVFHASGRMTAGAPFADRFGMRMFRHVGNEMRVAYPGDISLHAPFRRCLR